MASDAYPTSNGHSHSVHPTHAISPMSQPNPFDMDLMSSNLPIGPDRNSGRPDAEADSAVLIRKLPRHTSSEALRSMLLFSKDLLSADFVPPEAPEDNGYLCAIARFRTPNAAVEVRKLLDGKTNAANEAPMIVDILRLSPGGGRRNTYDMSNRGVTGSVSSAGSSGGQIARGSSRFNGTFQAMDRISPPNAGLGLTNGNPANQLEHPGSDLVSPFQGFSPLHSPIGQPLERQRISGKSVIGEDGADEEPVDLLKDPVAYAKNDMSNSMGQLSRHSSHHNQQIPSSRFGPLSLNTASATSPPMSALASPRGVPPMQSPTGAMSPTNMAGMGPNAPYQFASQNYGRHNYPPVNPADQNPPCNTLYVGNLPIDTSEDELKTMFSKQRGYKRLCFRTKQNGPMCFVEFEDVSFATKALNELYGHPLHNSVKGGIRLSFSKNPLGVRTGQPGGMGPPAPMSPQGTMGGMNGMGNMQPFTSASGPPPGLTAPPGLGMNPSTNGATINGLGSPTGGMAANGPMMGSGFGSSGAGMAAMGMRSPQASMGPNSASGPWATQNNYSDYMFGR